jgi:hypothetical protein
LKVGTMTESSGVRAGACESARDSGWRCGNDAIGDIAAVLADGP